MTYSIKVDGLTGQGKGHVLTASLSNPVTSPVGTKDWYKSATLTKPTASAHQDLSGPVYDVALGTIAYTLVDKSVADKKALISQEAERRLSAGLTLSSGVLFKCDNVSINRIQGMLHGAFPKTFSTSAGVAVTVPDLAAAQAIVDEVADYVAAVLKASSDLQTSLPADFTSDLHWP